MTITPKRDRLSPPLMLAFRLAHEARDARKKLNLRDEFGERVIAGRRSAGRFPISETLLRREVSHDLETLLNTIALVATYEPRLDRKTIRVRRDGSVGPEQLKLRFIVHADLKAEPLNVPVEFVADVDLDSGDIQINRL
jgi:type VI secretion system protein ImpF